LILFPEDYCRIQKIPWICEEKKKLYTIRKRKKVPSKKENERKSLEPILLINVAVSLQLRAILENHDHAKQ